MSTVIYTKPGCPYCAVAKQDLEARAWTTARSTSTRRRARAIDLAELTGGMNVVPVVVEGGEVRVAAGGG